MLPWNFKFSLVLVLQYYYWGGNYGTMCAVFVLGTFRRIQKCCGFLCSEVSSVLGWFSRETIVTRDLLVLVGTFCGGLILGLPDLAY